MSARPTLYTPSRGGGNGGGGGGGGPGSPGRAPSSPTMSPPVRSTPLDELPAGEGRTGDLRVLGASSMGKQSGEGRTGDASSLSPHRTRPRAVGSARALGASSSGSSQISSLSPRQQRRSSVPGLEPGHVRGVSYAPSTWVMSEVSDAPALPQGQFESLEPPPSPKKEHNLLLFP
jgi:hypothetical protein